MANLAEDDKEIILAGKPTLKGSVVFLKRRPTIGKPGSPLLAWGLVLGAIGCCISAFLINGVI
jgi:hypothetical protein